MVEVEQRLVLEALHRPEVVHVQELHIVVVHRMLMVLLVMVVLLLLMLMVVLVMVVVMLLVKLWGTAAIHNGRVLPSKPSVGSPICSR